MVMGGVYVLQYMEWIVGGGVDGIVCSQFRVAAWDTDYRENAWWKDTLACGHFKTKGQ